MHCIVYNMPCNKHMLKPKPIVMDVLLGNWCDTVQWLDTRSHFFSVSVPYNLCQPMESKGGNV